ncbi:S8 family serine peptidase [Bacillus sp. IBL03825]|uniref:S8 family peptidase n=1 Tax=Bacillus sp. IBL03825 TaxID=2953580 RepID=UPI0021575FCB|nr:S8 family serine peptidase [Bacillus sp. IBL03825]MCR6850513.1 S8 family serine peptidase [Bacillus sp. IBL03825]
MKFLKYIFIFLLAIQPVTLVQAERDIDHYYTLVLKDNRDYKKAKEIINRHAGEITYSVQEIGVLQVKAKEKDMKKIGHSPIIKTFNNSVRVIDSQSILNQNSNNLSDNKWDYQWDMKKITNGGKSYEIFPGTKNVTVGIIDSGLDIEHPDLKNNIVYGSENLVPRGGLRGTESREAGDINNINDILGHGTSVAGQIAANGVLKGVAPGIGIKSYRVFGGLGGESIWIMKGIVEAAKDDIDVINLSLGTYLLDGTYLRNGEKISGDVAEIEGYKRAINYAKSQGSITVAASGNDGLNITDKKQMDEFFKLKLDSTELAFEGEVLDIPASLPNVVTVSSSGPSNEISVFTNYGEGFTDITAPGGDLRLLSERGPDTWIEDKLFEKEHIISTTVGGGYSYRFGSSVAAPKVSATLALIIDKYGFKDKPNESIKFLYENGVDGQEDNKILKQGSLNVYKAVTK